jgi:hypothetical protein
MKNAYTSMFMESYVDNLSYALSALSKVLRDNSIRFCILGGASLPYFGYNRTTEDVDILVDDRDKGLLKNIPPSYLRDISGTGRVFRMHNPLTKVEVIYSGDMLNGKNRTPYKRPEEIREPTSNYITLYWLILYKIESQLHNPHRGDFRDVVQLIKENDLDVNYMESAPKEVDKVYRKLYTTSQERDMWDVEGI